MNVMRIQCILKILTSIIRLQVCFSLVEMCFYEQELDDLHTNHVFLMLFEYKICPIV